MPLLDHFHAPVKDLLGWESLHAAWTTHIANALNERWLSQRFLAVEHRHIGPRVEVDVEALERPTVSTAPASGNGPVATMPQTWTVPMNFFADSEPARLPDDVGLYAASYRPVRIGGRDLIEVWTHRLALGESLPTMPLRLVHELFVPVEFETTYAETCRRRRVV
jgi:hypothetical protein